MNWLLHFKEAYANLMASKLRSFLAVLGILVGTSSVVAMISGGQLATAHTLKQFSELGTDLLAISIFRVSEQADILNTSRELTITDLINLKRFIPDITAIAPYITVHKDISYQGHLLQGNIIGSVPALKDVIQINISQGRFITAYDLNEPFCVIGVELANELISLGIKNPLYKNLRIADRYYTVIGVIAPWQENSFFNQDINKSIIVPIDTIKFIASYTTISNIVMRLTENANISVVQAKMENIVHKLSPDRQLFFRSAKQLIASMTNQRNTLTLLLALIGSISLFVGGIGVMNIMLVSVVERRREIGIRKAVGARNKDIRCLFLVESVALSLFGGTLGVVIGLLTAYIIAVFAGWQFEWFLLPPLIGFLVSTAVGIFFGYYPAYKASLLDPIQTLRAE